MELNANRAQTIIKKMHSGIMNFARDARHHCLWKRKKTTKFVASRKNAASFRLAMPINNVNSQRTKEVTRVFLVWLFMSASQINAQFVETAVIVQLLGLSELIRNSPSGTRVNAIAKNTARRNLLLLK